MNRSGGRLPRIVWLALPIAVVAVLAVSWPSLAGSSSATTTPAAAKTWTRTTRTIASGGITRSYDVLVPSPLPRGSPSLVMVLPGRSATPAGEEKRTDFKAVATQAVLVYPAGYKTSWNAGSCCGGAHQAGINDVAFITAVVKQVLAQYPQIPADRVYLAGYSNGGKMAWAMVCSGSTLFRAVATYGAVPAEACPTIGHQSVLIASGTVDPETDVDNPSHPVTDAGFTEPTVDQMVAEVVAADECSSATRVATTGTLTTTTWTRCSTGTRVQLALYQGLAHGWPDASDDPSAPSGAATMWAYFRSLGA